MTRASGGLGPAFWRLWSASGASNLADGVFQVALPLVALRRTGSPVALAAVTLAARLPWLLVSLPAGALADRLDRRRTMVRVDVARVVLLGGLAALVAVEAESLAVLYLVAFTLGVAEVLFDTSAQPLLPSLVPRDDLERANGRLYAAETVAGTFLGPPLGGVLAAASLAVALAVPAAGYAVAAVLLVGIAAQPRSPRADAPRTRIRTDVAEGLRYLWRHPVLRDLALVVGGLNLATAMGFAVLPLFAVTPGPMGLGPAGLGLLLSAAGIGSLLATPLAPALTRRLGRQRLLALAVLACAVPLATPAVTAAPVAVGASLFVVGAGVILWNVATVSLRQRIVPDALLGRVNAAYRLLAWGGQPVGALLGGIVGQLLGLRWTFALAALGSVPLVVLLRSARDEVVDRLEAEAGA